MVDEVVAATAGALIHGTSGAMFEGIVTDSRAVTGGNLFIAIVGDRFDGHEFIASALDRGAAGFVVQRKEKELVSRIPETVPVIFVDDTVRALGDIAHCWRMRFDVPVVAVTGSSGKTTTKEMIASIVSQVKRVHKNRGNFNNLIGLPLTLLEMEAGHEVAIVEMGTNRPGEIARLTDIAKPSVGVITNVGPAHLEGLKSIDGVREEKGDLFARMEKHGIAIINSDDDEIRVLAERWHGERITFGIKDEALIHAHNIEKKDGQGIRFTLCVGSFEGDVTMKTLGNHNIYNALAAAASSLALGIEESVICEGIARFEQIPGRMKLYRLRGGACLVDDTYNANPASVREALRTLRDLEGVHRITVILGDMLELGDTSEELHEDIGRFLSDSGVGTVFIRGKFSRAVAAGAQQGGLRNDRIFCIESPEEIAAKLASCIGEGEWILIKGSRGMKMEEITGAIIARFGNDTDTNGRKGV